MGEQGGQGRGREGQGVLGVEEWFVVGPTLEVGDGSWVWDPAVAAGRGVGPELEGAWGIGFCVLAAVHVRLGAPQLPS